MDCYGDPEIMGKIGTDIEDGKCSWLVVVALQKANSKQQKIIEVLKYYNLFYVCINNMSYHFRKTMVLMIQPKSQSLKICIMN